MSRPLGLYIHFPYCLRLCPYCDFAVSVHPTPPEARYAKAVLSELDLRLQSGVPKRPLQSVYFGGGTPSLWDPRFISEVLEGIASRMVLEPGLEVTLEANPERLDVERLRGFRAAGIGRLSLGIQSFDDAILHALGRMHRGPQAEAAFAAARTAGFENVTLDLIYGVQGQTLEQVKADARRAVALEPEHLSAYGLTLDSEVLAHETLLSRRRREGKLVLPPDEVVNEMADALADTCEAVGLKQYEISNFARPGRESRHNLLYWHGDDSLALGCGAVGFLRTGVDTGARYSNLRDASAYLEAVERGELPEAERERLDAQELWEERMMTGLRLTDGVELAAIRADLGQPPVDQSVELNRMEAEGWLQQKEGRVALTRRGRHLHSSISARLA